VDDVESARKQLESRGVSFQGETLDSGVCYEAYFQDPDGNALILHHRYARLPGSCPKLARLRSGPTDEAVSR
jgi:hypothetical protein